MLPKAISGAALAAISFALLAAPATAAPAATGSVTVVHGVRGLLADVYLDGQPALRGFAPERITDPLTIPAGSHAIAVRRAGTPATSPAAVSANVDVHPGARLSIAVGLDASGTPDAQVFDDAAAIRGGPSIAFRHLAAASGVQVHVDGAPIGGPLTSGGQQLRVVPPGTHPVSVTGSAGSAPLLPGQDVPVAPSATTALYLIGSAKDNSLGWLAATLPDAGGKAAPPKIVRTGDSGLAARGAGFPTVATALFGVALAAAAALGMSRTRRLAAARRRPSHRTM